ncbi:TPA: portal protein [Acinetobacter baumannii]|uniref:portal protein n=1 Tax=Acinetobacter baumannii TaxID=470 RepID=UPI001FF600D3|nr:portal protein [Acinetobacter baumannii]EKW8719878.1 portal protein p19 [Acinetobacter baumannii]ELB7302682.1 portal protein p19 [Acinetobacter baumannii]ELH1395691.1 portal protein p19 [Acinetobacter baumannii]ELH1447047.1 portal protein p19 [Acinetobacter baumannii]MCJ9477067.1 portal protein p19 [Acinetobacter baumannii]
MTKEKDQDSILDEIKKNLRYAEDYWHDNYERGVEDKEFVTVKGAQWEDGAVARRTAEGKPSLEFNLCRAYCRQQINTQRQNRAQVKVVPVDNGADADKANIIEGLIKDTEESSDAESAYDQAAENAVYGAIGFFRIVTDYVSELSFNQEPRFMTVHNPHAWYIDPQSKALDGSDARWAVGGEWVDRDIIEDKYGANAVVDFAMSEYSDWCNTEDKTVLIVEYFKIEEVSDELWMLEDGTTNYKSALLDEFGVSEDELKPLVINSRSTTRTEVKWYKASGSEVLEETVFPGKYIPVIPVYGEVTYIGEERYLHSLVHFAKDPQRLYNYWKSTEAQILQKNQDDILVVDPKGVSGYEEEWRDPAKFAAVHYKHIDDSQQPIPAPYRIGAAQPPVGVLNAAESAKVAITDILNMHAPIMGGDSQEVSGVAIGMRQRQSETAQFHLQDNLNKSIRHAGRILLGLYQALYTVPMVRRIIGADGEAKQINLFDKTADGVLADVTIGRYDVRMDTGPSFNTQREQNFALMMQLLSMNPQLFSLIGDILLQNSPLLNAKEISERIRSTMPPQVLGKGEQIDPEQAKAQIQQLDQLVQKMTADIEMLQKEVNDKDKEHQLEMFKAQLQYEKDIKVAQINAASRADVQELKGAVDLMKQQVASIGQMPAKWMQTGEGVDNYAPSPPTDLTSQPMEEEQPIEPAQSIQNPDIDQGFLMPEQNAQPLALDPDQIEESAMINEGNLLPQMEQDNGSEQF